jgi:hypothetical protein
LTHPALTAITGNPQAKADIPSPTSRLTDSERQYLERLLAYGNAEEMEAASSALENAAVFFPDHHHDDGHDREHHHHPGSRRGDEEGMGRNGVGSVRTRRDSRLQQQLYRIHETADIHPSQVISRMSHLQESYLRSNSILQDDVGGSFSLDNDDMNSIVSRGNNNNHRGSGTSFGAKHGRGTGGGEDVDEDEPRDPFEDVAAWLIMGQQGGGGASGVDAEAAAALSSPAFSSSPSPYSTPFKILGTSGSDASCHPHVLTPPLMDALFNFCPEASTLCKEETEREGGGSPGGTGTSPSNHPAVAVNWWLKYSRARDGGGLSQMLRQVRGSKYTVLAVETTTGHVLGSFTSSPWRLSKGWYGGGMQEEDVAAARNDDEDRAGGGRGAGDEKKDDSESWPASAEPETLAYVWKMRHPRCLQQQSPPSSSPSSAAGATAASIVQQVCQESEIQVFPLRTSATAAGDDAGSEVASDAIAVQSCSLADGIRLGQNELLPAASSSSAAPNSGHKAWDGEHYGYALAIDPALRSGSTSTSETFGNPCLIRSGMRGETFELANLEIWTLTTRSTVADAENAELKRLFLSRP